MTKIPDDGILRREIDPEKIRQRRLELGLSLMDLALMLYTETGFRVHPQTLSNWEKGKCYPTRKRLAMLSDVLKVPRDFFFVNPLLSK